VLILLKEGKRDEMKKVLAVIVAGEIRMPFTGLPGNLRNITIAKQREEIT
jgi:hypothetical protein